MYKILIIGSGAREHAIAWSIYKDSRIDELFCSPGNAGTSLVSKNIEIDIMDNNSINLFVKENNINLIIVGPEQPLENGIVDYFETRNIKIFGPNKYASQLETSKLFARNIMEKYNIPQPAFFECNSEEEILSIQGQIGLPLVLKADGLAGGKGVIICRNLDDFHSGIDDMVKNRKFGSASNKISVEECLSGEELSVFAICDGNNYKIIGSAQDHKRAYDYDKGPNTGGMGAYSPAPLFNDTLKAKVENNILEPILKALEELDNPFKGFLYIGIMLVDDEPYVIEFNVRLGDPEAQVLLPLINSSVLDMILYSIDGTIKDYKLKLDANYAVAVVLAAKGYPEDYKKGMIINGLDSVNHDIIFHAGTKIHKNKVIANGGRVLSVVGLDLDLNKAISKAYESVKIINFIDKYYRSDIGLKATVYLNEKE